MKYIVLIIAFLFSLTSCKNETKEVAKEIKTEVKQKVEQKKVEQKVQVGDSTLVYKVSLGVLPDLAYKGQGVKIVRVSKNRPGFLGGLKEGDIVKKIDGKPVTDLIGYTKMLGGFTKGESVELSIDRAGKMIKANIVFD